MMLVSTLRQPFDHVLAVPGDIHFDPTAYAHAPRPFRCVVDTGKGILEHWITRCVGPALDQELLLVHAVTQSGWVRPISSGVDRPNPRRGETATKPVPSSLFPSTSWRAIDAASRYTNSRTTAFSDS